MRYYSIEIEGGKTYTSFQNGSTIPGALNVEIDIPVIAYDLPMGGALIRIWGISLQDIGQASDNNNKNIKVFAGFQKGLPLANPKQAGLILQGYIFQAYGNWISTDQTLDFIVLAGSAPGTGASKTTKNLAFNWKAGTQLKDAINTTLTTAYPGFTADINIDSKLVLPQDAPGYYTNLTQFSQFIRNVSKGIIGGQTYQGVSITLQEKKFAVFDGTTAAKAGPKQIDFKDLIGQPTWIDAPSIQFKCAMRADLKVGDVVKMPQTQVTNSAQAQTSLVNQKVAFQGSFQISVMRHVGNFRQPDSNAWVTVFNAFPTTKAA